MILIFKMICLKNFLIQVSNLLFQKELTIYYSRNDFLHLFSRLGHGDLALENTVSPPCRVETLHMLQIKVLSVSCGGEHTVALTQQGVRKNCPYNSTNVLSLHIVKHSLVFLDFGFVLLGIESILFFR